MNKSTMLFLGGAVLGAAVTAVAFTGGVYDADKGKSGAGGLSVSHSGQQSTDEQLLKLAKITENLNVTAGALKNSAETLTSLTLPITLVKGKQMSTGAAVDAKNASLRVDNNNVEQEPAAEPAQPTPKQVDRFTEIRSRLADAANNHAIPLAALVQEANDLTPEQRQQLTSEALDMIKRGELRAEQFMELPGS